MFAEFIDERGQNDVERNFRFSFDVVYNLFINKFDKNIWLVFLSSKFATHQSLSLRDSTIASAVSKIQALTLKLFKWFERMWALKLYKVPKKSKHCNNCTVQRSWRAFEIIASISSSESTTTEDFILHIYRGTVSWWTIQ